MTDVPLMFQPLVKYAEFNGRSRRSEFWLWILFRFIVNSVLGTGMLAFVGPIMMTAHDHPEIFISRYFTVLPIFSLISLALLIPTLAVSVRRLHDINRTGWWLLMPIVVSIVGMIVFGVIFGVSLVQMIGHGDNIPDAEGLAFVLKFIGAFLMCFALPVLIAEIVLLVFFVTEGNRAPNRFGADPKGLTLTAETFS